MNMTGSLRALRTANPRTKTGFNESVDAVAGAVRAQIATSAALERRTVNSGPRRHRLVRLSLAGTAVAAAAAVTAFFAVGSPNGGGPGIANAAAAVRKAATVTAASADRSGTAVVRITHNGEPWAGTTVRWHGAALLVSSDMPRRPGRAGSKLLVVDGILYGFDPADGGWVELGSPTSIDPGSGTTPGDYLAAVRDDVGGATLRRIVDGMNGLTRRLADGSTVYSGTVAAGLIARGSGFKEGRSIRLLPFGYVAHGDAADPAAPLDVAVTVGADGIVRAIAVTWGTSASAWTYTVTYSSLGRTSAPVAPANARPLRDHAGSD
jgi:hypothetical protein